MEYVERMIAKLKQVGFPWVQLHEEAGSIILPGHLTITYDAQTFSIFHLMDRDVSPEKCLVGCNKDAMDVVVLQAWNSYNYKEGMARLSKEPAAQNLDTLYENDMAKEDSGVKHYTVGFYNGKPLKVEAK